MAQIYEKIQYKPYYESNSHGTMEVINRRPRELHIRFVNTGYTTWALAANVLAGKVKDHSVIYKAAEKAVNEIVDTNVSGKCLILTQTGKSCVIQFLETGFTRTAHIDNVRAGKVRDPYSKTYLGIGYLGEYKHTPYHKQAIQLWSNMIKRCYNPKDPRGYFGTGVIVDARWHCFAHFLEDLPALDNFGLWLEGQKAAVKYNLDKDLKFLGNKVYSRETCMFVTEFENKSAGGINRQKIKLGKG